MTAQRCDVTGVVHSVFGFLLLVELVGYRFSYSPMRWLLLDHMLWLLYDHMRLLPTVRY